jgi:hypothetical protein
MPGLLLTFALEVGLITYRDIKGARSIASLPLPADYLAAVGLWGILGIIGHTSDGAGKVTTAVGAAFVLGTALNVWSPQTPTKIGKTGQQPTTTGGTT